MQPGQISSRPLTRSATLLACAGIVLASSLMAASKRPMKKLTYDPSAESVELFDGIESGDLDVTVIPKSALAANVFVANKSSKPLTVKLPKAVAAVQVLKQGFGGGMGGMGGGGGFGGGAQAAGGGFGGGAFGGGGFGGIGGGAGVGGFGSGNLGIGGGGAMGLGGGAGFFSIPSDAVVQLPLNTVCLEHGKPDPQPKMRYKLVPIETYTSDPVLQELMVMVGSGTIDPAAAQAAAWNIANDMSWEKLAAKQIEHLGGVPPEPYFSRNQLAAAQQVASQAAGRVRERKEKEAEQPEAGSKSNRRPETKQ